MRKRGQEASRAKLGAEPPNQEAVCTSLRQQLANWELPATTDNPLPAGPGPVQEIHLAVNFVSV